MDMMVAVSCLALFSGVLLAGLVERKQERLFSDLTGES
jgi:hypothetical protein